MQEQEWLPAWTVYTGYTVRSGVIVVADESERRMYTPLEAPVTPATAGPAALVLDFARVRPGDEASALAFTRKWGELGWRHAVIPAQGDPLLWLWAHAHGVRIALDLAELLKRDDDGDLSDYLAAIDNRARGLTRAALRANALLQAGGETRQPAALASVLFTRARRRSPRRRRGVTVVFGDRYEIGGGYVGARSARETARALLAAIINGNLPDAHLELDRSSRLSWSFTSLIGPLYRHLADLVTTERLVQCRYCHTPFRPEHGRQRYCPPPPWVAARGGESACALKARTKRFRSSRKERSQ